MNDLERLRTLAGLPGPGPTAIPNGTLREVGEKQYEVFVDGQWIKAVLDELDHPDDEAMNMSEHRLMERYPEDAAAEKKYVAITEIVVPTARDKDQILRAIKYLHDNLTIDTEFYGVNTLVHMYERPDLIKVQA